MTTWVRHMAYLMWYFDSLVSYLYPFVMHLYGLKSTVKEIQGLKVKTGGHFEFMLMIHFPVIKFW